MMMQMEKLQQQECDMELMKTAMLKHEETFRQQVHDLHRLYRIQRRLMSDLARCPSTMLLPCQQGQRRRQHPRRSEMNLQLPVSRGACRQATPLPRESEDELELTLAVGSGSDDVDGGTRRERKRWEGTFCTTTPSSSTDSSGALRQIAAACDLREGVVAKQPQLLVRCLSLRMA